MSGFIPVKKVKNKELEFRTTKLGRSEKFTCNIQKIPGSPSIALAKEGAPE